MGQMDSLLVTQLHYGMMMLGLNAGRGAKACQGLAACTAPPTLGGADTTILGGTELATSPPTGFESLNPTPEGRQFQPPPRLKPNC